MNELKELNQDVVILKNTKKERRKEDWKLLTYLKFCRLI